MIKAAAMLPPISAPEPVEGARVAFLSGGRFWHQTLFCFASLQLHCPHRVTPEIFDDGTFSDASRHLIQRVAPWAEFVDCHVIEERLDRYLPSASFPSLRARRIEYPHLRKLTDIHLAAAGWTLVMDSDMLFFRRPDALLSWFRNPHDMFMQDFENAYGYSSDLMNELAGGPVPDRVNVGLYAVYSPSIDWDRMEYWCRSQIEKEGPSYFQEQALTALLFTNAAKRLSSDDYVVWPSLAEGRRPTAVLHHYVAHSKRSYFQHGWRRVLPAIEVGNSSVESSEEVT